MRILKRRVFCLYLLVIGYLLVFVSTTKALRVSPGRAELSVPPGATYKGYYEITNSSDIELFVQIEARDWVMDEEGGLRMFVPPKELSSLKSKWFQLDTDEVIVPPNTTRKVEYTITISERSQGEFRKYLIFKSAPRTKKKEALNIATQISVPLYVIVKGTEIFDAEIKDIQILNAAPVELKIRVYNSGNVHIRPVGEVVIKRKGQKEPVLTMPVNTPAPGWPVLPKQGFRFLLYNSKRLESGTYDMTVKFQYQDTILTKKLMFSVDEKKEVTILAE